MKLTKGDMILIALLIVFSIFLAFYMSKVSDEIDKKYVSIQVNGEEIDTIEFSKDIIGKTYRIETEYGHNVLEFGDEEVKIIDASCLDKLCINQGTINKVGQLLVCLPNRVVVEIKTNDDATEEIDGSTF